MPGAWAERPTLEDVRRSPLGEVSRAYANLYRLVPDARFREAFVEVERLILATAPSPQTLTWEGRDWALRSGSKVVAVLPESPGYDATLTELTNRAKAMGWPLPGRAPVALPDAERLRAQIESLDPVKIVGALRELDNRRSSGPADGPSLDLAADGFARLLLVTFDRLQMSDVLAARAVACLALADLANPRDRTREHVILAASLGYELDARRRAQRLPRTDPVRLWAEDAPAPRVAAASSGDDPLGSYVALLAMSGKGPESFDAFLRERFPEGTPELAILAAGGRVAGLEAPDRFGTALLLESSRLVAGPPAAPPRAREVRRTSFEEFVAALIGRISSTEDDAALGRTIAQFEGSLSRASEADRGPFWDRRANQAWARSSFYSGVHLLGRLRLDRYGHPGATKAFAESLAGAPPDGPAAGLRLWYEARAASVSGTPKGPAEIDAIASYGPLGAEPMANVVEDLHAQVPEQGPATLAAVAASLDGRPASIVLLFRYAHGWLEDPNQVDRSCRNYLAHVRPTSWFGIWCAGLLGQRQDLQAALDSVDLPPTDRLAALRALRKLQRWNDAQIRRSFEALRKSVSWEHSITTEYLTYLEEEREDFRASERLLRAWLADHSPGDEGLGYAVRQARLARAVARQGRVEQAWAEVEPLLRTGQASVLVRASEIQALRGNVGEALELAFACIDRYPQEDWIRVDVAEIAWSLGRHADATRALRPADRPLSAYRLFPAAKVFPKATRGRPDEEVKEALAQFFGERPDPTLLKAFADELGPERPQLAYEILAGVTGRGADLAFYRVAAAGWLAKAQGQEAADRWLGEAIPPNVRAFASSAYFDSGQDRLLWTLAAPPGGEPLPVTWLLRASAYRLRGGDAEQQEQLEKFAHSAPPDDPHHALTVRYLLEKPDAYPSELPEVPGARATWAWAAAVDRMARGDYPAASDLFHLTQLLDRGTGTGGYLGACAYKCVRDWLDAERPLAEIAASDREVVKTGTKQN